MQKLRDIVTAWAQQRPRVAAIYLFGSRANGTARHDSDIDLALVVTDDPDESAWTYAMFERAALIESLAPLLAHALDLQFAFEGDSVVMPAVLDHGILLYQAPASASLESPGKVEGAR